LSDLTYKVAWGISGSGDRLPETIHVMKEVANRLHDRVVIQVYLSKAGFQVVKYYQVLNDLKNTFGELLTEINPNSPFLAGAIQLQKFDFFLIAPATGNTVAKISLGIADTLLCNAAIMALKSFVPVYVMPSDYQEGIMTTKLPNGQDMRLKIRKEDVAHVIRLGKMEGISVLKTPEAISNLFTEKYIQERA
jgi:archaeoflavoprotein AfpA